MSDSLKNKITVLVNVHNRHEHLTRQLDYIHRHYTRILVFDSSDVEYAHKDAYPNVEYHYYPNWEYVDKLSDIVKKVETPYVHLCADDDFFIPDAVFSCASFMEQNPDYASVHGHYLTFHWDGKHFDTQPLYTNYIGRDVNSDVAAIRLSNILTPYIQLLYAVHRTENLKDSFCCASASNIHNHRLVELLVSIISSINGKHKVLPVFYSARELLYNSAGTFIPTVNEVLQNETLSGEAQRFSDLIVQHLYEKTGLSKVDAQDSFNSSFDCYLRNKTRKVRQLHQALPPAFRIWFNRFRYREGGWKSIALPRNSAIDEIQSYVSAHNC